jgi:DNA ligase D-like protein (predicted 3'-phosphoesterase)
VPELILLIGREVSSVVKKQKSLNQYRQKRDFAKAAEPRGRKKSSAQKKRKQPLFVVQQHAARAMHYDFRLEIDGVLVSWAVPKGPSTNPRDKRLAVLTENHPLEYADFEGVIPEGQYGAGEVIVWDRGMYENLKSPKSLADCFADGALEFFVHGEKLQGGYALVRMKESDKTWLLIKMADEYADLRRNSVTSEPESVLSGETINDLKKKRGES